MPILHPFFTIVTLLLMAYSFLEFQNDKKYKSAWGVVAFMILLMGLRNWIGADYGAYVQMFMYFGRTLDYSVFVERAFFGSDNIGVEWLYVLLGKLVHDSHLPFFVFTFILAVFSIGIKYISFQNISAYPALSMLLYMFPSYFLADGGHMRQAVAMAVAMFSFLFIRSRNLLMFLFIMYIAVGFHKSAFVFVFAYWLVLVPLNSNRILWLVLLCAVLSPFDIYKYISLLDSIAPEEVFEGFQAYEAIGDSSNGKVRLNDLVSIMYTYFLVAYDKEGSERIPYYEYMRNIGVVAVCMYFIFRGSPIFSTRLTAYYWIYMVMVLPNIVAAVQNLKLKRMLYIFLILFVVFYYFVITFMQASRAGYTIEGYRNYLW